MTTRLSFPRRVYIVVYKQNGTTRNQAFFVRTQAEDFADSLYFNDSVSSIVIRVR
jgi:hypothetical protein